MEQGQRSSMRKLTLWLFLMMPGFAFLASADNPHVDFSANIVENTCQVAVSNDGLVHLSTVGTHFFSDLLTPESQSSGTAFSINVTGCGGTSSGASKLHFSFSPQSGAFPAQSSQVFPNNTTVATGGAANVGVVIFSSLDNTNVLKKDGTSDVVLPATSESLINRYDFYARYQHLDTPGAGKVTSNVLVSVTYE
ncbi:fimbrial-like protein [unidentified bacterial endosymbiont]|uniref:fimbrial-like protein n=1 Tax=unidentified bacterial endosymbiont TaxID=2355 RepID=UPI002646EE45|nr:fimbrial-like protein [unidentified bacterial endosymbiont]